MLGAMPEGAKAVAPTVGNVTVIINAPDGVPANVFLNGATKQLASKPPSGTSTRVSLSLPVTPVSYRVDAPPVTFAGTRYLGISSRPTLVISPGQSSELQVTYSPEAGAQQIHATSVTPNSVSLAWTASPTARFALRRTPGTTPAANVQQGTTVPVAALGSVDGNLTPGATYTYSLFTQDRSRWYGPLAITATTPNSTPDGSMASYIAPPSTLILEPTDIAAITTLDVGVRVRLQAQISTPLLGSGVVLPASDTLAGGLVGVVRAISTDGRTVELDPAGLADAFDYYELSVPSFSVTGAPPDESQPAAGPQNLTHGIAGLPAQLPAASAQCGRTRGSGNFVNFTPTLKADGHFATKVDKFASVPVKATVNAGLTIRLTGAAEVQTTLNVRCNVTLPHVFRTFQAGPVPMAISFRPTAEFNIQGAWDIRNVGLTVTSGFNVTATMGVSGNPNVSVQPIMNATPLTPQVVTSNGSLNLRTGGELTFGPGAGTSGLGIIAGINGAVHPFDASFGPKFPHPDPRFNQCLQLAAGKSWALTLAVKAFLGKLSLSASVPLMSNTTPWFPTQHYPSGCQDLQAPSAGTPDTLLGGGVTKVDDVTSGSGAQWGHVDGFAPGQKTWVLSTGQISDAIGAPSQFASTGMGQPGDAQLSALAGHSTNDAASYQVTITPTGSTLHVRYVFASEEYPEYVGSSFNDVMAVFVNGTNCAVVPGTSTPVSINTVNDHTNSNYYVDNSTGAAGYGTTMDGLTVPLTCSVPVVPGQPVTVRIAVADSSDSSYDSAVALLDGGIWAD
ncbi:choice-of-anchor L domain-containing protein [Geodermatophilus pulveris]|nr:choice-of-anchor L domain-containing protein [Geodermatophilus pulveris]